MWQRHDLLAAPAGLAESRGVAQDTRGAARPAWGSGPDRMEAGVEPLSAWPALACVLSCRLSAAPFKLFRVPTPNSLTSLSTKTATVKVSGYQTCTPLFLARRSSLRRSSSTSRSFQPARHYFWPDDSTAPVWMSTGAASRDVYIGRVGWITAYERLAPLEKYTRTPRPHIITRSCWEAIYGNRKPPSSPTDSEERLRKYLTGRHTGHPCACRVVQAPARQVSHAVSFQLSGIYNPQ